MVLLSQGMASTSTMKNSPSSADQIWQKEVESAKYVCHDCALSIDKTFTDWHLANWYPAKCDLCDMEKYIFEVKEMRKR